MPRRKPPEQRQGRGTADLVPAGGRLPMPDPDPTWGTDTVLAWEQFWLESDNACVVVESDLPTLRRLFDCRDMRARAAAFVRDEPMVTGSTGQPVVNPMAKEVHAYDSEIDRLEKLFGLGPFNRLSLGVTAGDAAKSLDEQNRRMMGGPADPVADDPRFK